MKVICAWHGGQIGYKKGEGETHRICKPCKARYFPQPKSVLDDIFWLGVGMGIGAAIWIGIIYLIWRYLA